MTGYPSLPGLPRGRVPALALRVLMLALCVVLIGWSVHSIGPRRVLDAALAADPRWLVLSLAAIGLRYLTWSAKWWRMMRRSSGDIGLGTTLRAVLSGTFVNLVTPSANIAGGVLRAVIVQRRTGWRLASSYGWSLADQVTNFLGALALGGVLAVAIALGLPPPAGRPVLAAGLAALGLTVLFLALRRRLSDLVRSPAVARAVARFTPARFRQDGPEGPAAEWFPPMMAPIFDLGSSWRVAAWDITQAGASRFALCLASAMVFRALGIGAPLLEVAAVLLLATFVGSMSGAVGGIGATEVVLMGLYAKLGIPAEAAAAATLLHRGTFYGISFLGGAAAMFAGSRRRAYDEPALRREPPPAASPPDGSTVGANSSLPIA